MKLKKYLIGCIKFYQKYFSRDHAFWARDNEPYCRYIPSCSEYCKEAIEKQGIVLGGLKGFWRICRCMPWSKGGYDPVQKKEGTNK